VQTAPRHKPEAGYTVDHLSTPLSDPSEAQLRAIKERQGLELLEPERDVAIRQGVLQLRIPFPLPSVSLIEIRPVP
jgi:hypothetical protein